MSSFGELDNILFEGASLSMSSTVRDLNLDDEEEDSKTADTLRIGKATRMMAKKEKNRFMLHPEMSRALFIPLADVYAENLKNRNDSERAIKRNALYRELSNYTGNICAAEEQWDNNK